MIENIFDYVDGSKHDTIELAAPVANINEWYQTNPPYYARFLGVDETTLEKIVYFADDVIIEGERKGEIISSEEIVEEKTLSGVEAVEFLISLVDYRKLAVEARQTEIQMMASEPSPEVLKRLEQARVLRDGIRHVLKGRFAIRKINIMPLEIRGKLKELIQSKMPYCAYDIEDLYNRVMYRNERVRKLIELEAPPIIIRNERRMLQEYVDTLINNGKRGIPFVGNSENCAYASLTDIVIRTTEFV